MASESIFRLWNMIQYFHDVSTTTETGLVVFQLTIRATDGRGNTVNATVSISITREPDDEIPFFVNTPYFASIQFDRPVGSSIQIVSARDQDLAVSISDYI